MRKSPDAFRTISEVAQDLDLPQHVLRFWETRFSQIKPMKRGGGRRYYRPDDVDLLRGIRHLLYDEGYTIKGVQKILKEQGVRHVIDAVSDDMGGALGGMETAPALSAEGAGASQTAPIHTEPNQLEVQTPPLITPQVQPSVHPAANHPVAATQVAPDQAVQTRSVVQPTPAPQHGLVQTATPPQAPQPPQPPLVQTPPSGPAGRVATAAAAPQTVIQQAPAQRVEPEIIEASGNLAVRSNPVLKESGTAPYAPPANEADQQTPLQQLARDRLPEEMELGQALPNDLVRGDPKFLHGESASVTVESGRARIAEDKQKAGFFDRLRGKSDDDADNAGKQGLARDDVRRLQSTLFELLECKRILDQARNDD